MPCEGCFACHLRCLRFLLEAHAAPWLLPDAVASSEPTVVRRCSRDFWTAFGNSVACVQITSRRGTLQKVNIMVCTYNEPMETVRACVQHLLDAEAPVYCEKVVYIGDDGAKKKFQCSEDKRIMVEEFNRRARPRSVPASS
jgi:hypothetical protein